MLNKIKFKKLGIFVVEQDKNKATKIGAEGILNYSKINDYLLIEKGSFSTEEKQKNGQKGFEVSVMARAMINPERYDFSSIK